MCRTPSRFPAYLLLASLAVAGPARAWDTEVWTNKTYMRGAQTETNVWVKFNYYTVTNSAGVVFTNHYLAPIYAFSNSLSPSLVQTQLLMDVRERRDLDAYMALQERYLFYNTLITDGAWGGALPRYYRWQRQNLVWTKYLIALNAGKFLDLTRFDTNGLLTALNDAIMANWALTNLLQAAGAPTNWHAYTPYRDLAGYGSGYSRVESNVWTFVTTQTVAVTTTAWGIWKNFVVTATNGQSFLVTTTNPLILDPYTTADYGYRHYTSIVNRMAWFGRTADAYRTNWYYGSGVSTNWTEATTLAEASISETSSGQNWGSEGEYFAGSGMFQADVNYGQGVVYWQNALSGDSNTLIDVDLYVWANDANADVLEWDDMGTPLTNYYAFGFWSGTTGVTTLSGYFADPVGDTSLPTWVSEPSGSDIYLRGFEFPDNESRAVIKPHWEHGGEGY